MGRMESQPGNEGINPTFGLANHCSHTVQGDSGLVPHLHGEINEARALSWEAAWIDIGGEG